MARRHASPGRPHLSQDPMLLPIPLQRLSGGVTPIPEIVTQLAPTTHFLQLAQVCSSSAPLCCASAA